VWLGVWGVAVGVVTPHCYCHRKRLAGGGVKVMNDTRHTSHVTRHTSNAARHTSHVTRHTSPDEENKSTEVRASDSPRVHDEPSILAGVTHTRTHTHARAFTHTHTHTHTPGRGRTGEGRQTEARGLHATQSQ